MRRELRWAAGAVVLAGVAWAARPHPGPPFEARPVPLHPDPAIEQVGALSWRGGLHLRAADAAFGGLSAMEVEPDGTLLALSDRGGWYRLRLGIEGGRLVGAELVEGGVLRDRGGRLGGRSGDAESMTRLDGRWLVGLEGSHRLVAGDPRDVLEDIAGPELSGVPSNKGLEALVTVGGEVLALLEGGGRGWRGVPGAWRPVTWPVVEPFVPTAATALGDGLVVLERAYDPVQGVRIRVLHVADPDHLEPVELARLVPPVSVDNLEAVTTLEVGAERWLLLLSDDNFRDEQRTLLLAFALGL